MISECPECGEVLQATVSLYLTNVVVGSEGEILSWDLAFGADADESIADAVTDADPAEIEIYCANGHPYGEEE